MKLTVVEIDYFSQKASMRHQDIAGKFHAESNRIGAPAHGISQTQVYVARIKNFAKDAIKSRVDTFIEVCREWDKFPNREDVNRFTTESEPFVSRKLDLYKEYRKNPFGEDISESTADAIEQTLAADLQKIFTDGLRPLRSFHLEGKVEEERQRQSGDEQIMKQANDTPSSGGRNIFVGRDYVQGNQMKAGDNFDGTRNIQLAAQPSSQKIDQPSASIQTGWTRDQKIMFVGVIVAITGILAAILFPELRHSIGLP